MRAIPEALAEALDAPLTTLAFCWRVQRADGVALGFTSHDRPLVADGMAFSPAPGMVPSAVSHAGTVEGGGMEVSRSEEHTSELQSLMRISYAVFCLKKKKTTH